MSTPSSCSSPPSSSGVGSAPTPSDRTATLTAPAIFDEAAARAVLEQAVRVTALGDGGRVSGAELVRIGSNAVFRLGPEVVARVTPPDPDADSVHRCLAVTAWLEQVGFPAVRAVPAEELDAVQPVTAGRHLVTFWRSLGPPGRRGTTRDLGRLLRALHALEPPPELGTPPAPPIDPVGRARRQLPLAPLPQADRSFLLRRLDAVAAAYEQLAFPLGHGLLHGDATVANVIVANVIVAGADTVVADTTPDRAGRAALLDFDLVRTGPREWDLLRTATYHHRLGWHTEGEYRDFCAGYGVDVATWPGFDVTADLSELLQVAWLAEAAERRPALVAELRTRMQTLRTGGSRRSWRAV